jgi:hypothetical protein
VAVWDFMLVINLRYFEMEINNYCVVHLTVIELLLSQV